MASHKHVSKKISTRASLSHILSNIGLIAAAIEARICKECNWDDDDFEYFCKRTEEIPEKKKVLINSIISSELLKRAVMAPAISVKNGGLAGMPVQIVKLRGEKLFDKPMV